MSADESAKIEQWLALAKGARGRAIADLIAKATAEPGLFGYAELLAAPSIQEIRANPDLGPHYQLLELFAFGRAASLPPLTPQQANKLKQLTVVSLALKTKVLPYATLQQELEIGTVRELEDFLITECFYSGILKGKLDQRAGSLQVHHVVGRDVRPEQLDELAAGLRSWMQTAESVLGSIEARVAYAAQAAEEESKRRSEAEAKAEEMKKNVKAEMSLEMRNVDMLLDEGGMGMDYMDEDRLGPTGPLAAALPGGGVERLDRAADRSRVSGRRRLR